MIKPTHYANLDTPTPVPCISVKEAEEMLKEHANTFIAEIMTMTAILEINGKDKCISAVPTFKRIIKDLKKKHGVN